MLRSKTYLLKIFLTLVAVESAWAFLSLISIPADSKNALYFGFSGSRLILITGILIFFLTTLSMLGRLIGFYSAAEDTVRSINGLILDSKKSYNLALFCGFVIVLGILFLLTPAERVGVSYFQRILPVIILGIAIALQALVFQFIWSDKKIDLQQLKYWNQSLLAAKIILIIVVVLSALIAWSGIGIRPERSGWFAPGTPVLFHQVLFAWAIALLFILINKRLILYKNLNKLDFIIGINLWLIAGLSWWREPIRRLSYFTTAPTPPNFESYPYSDSALYDMFAQNFLIGTSRPFGLTHRPLYSIFLAFLHTIGGQDFESIAALQVFFLAAFPVLIYLLASKLGGRPAGILAALVMIFRERNSIALTNVIEVSHSKLLMSDVPTMTMMLLFVYFFVKWLQDQANRHYLGVLAGSFLGFTVLIRSQAQLLIPVAFLCIIIAEKNGWKPIFRKSLIFLLSALVVILPWVWRNYQISGRVLVEYQDFYTRIIASGYTDNRADVDQLSSETLEQYNDRMTSMIANYILNNPQEVMRFYSAYFIHNEISSVIYLPMVMQFLDIRSYVKEAGFWDWPLGSLSAESLPMFFLTLGIIAIGIGYAFQRAKWIGIFPLIFHFVYSFSVVPFRASGWRFILPVDWVSVLYFSIGLMQVSIMLFSLFSQKRNLDIMPDMPINQNTHPQTFSWMKILPALCIVSVIGLSLPLIEWSMPVQYPAVKANELIPNLISDESPIPASDIEYFLATESSATLLYGRALYPSFYESGKYWGDDDSYPLTVRNMSRLQFQLIGPQGGFVFLPLLDSPDYFPHASDVFVLGCDTKDGVRALAVRVDDDSSLVTTSPWYGLTCITP